MGLFEKLKGPDINSAYEEYLKSKNAFLLDVRTAEEYRGGRLPKSINVPLGNLGKVEELVPERNARIYVYCQSGIRSRKAQMILHHMGYLNAVDMGGFSSYTGMVEK